VKKKGKPSIYLGGKVKKEYPKKSPRSLYHRMEPIRFKNLLTEKIFPGKKDIL